MTTHLEWEKATTTDIDCTSALRGGEREGERGRERERERERKRE